ncbi:hypothetical protein [Methylomonas rosea]|uniref:Uncharacterized protein n=1 Tax=Methylomonas rosea TaxID=2952227 RepID=A0ABT1TXL9_9GAMM|nr:hypothetical protein [Methylomonas sp. WSC-7]MCQ8119512.1 hypothetical protein [Methylomonas sp. WSC-7]
MGLMLIPGRQIDKDLRQWNALFRLVPSLIEIDILIGAQLFLQVARHDLTKIVTLRLHHFYQFRQHVAGGDPGRVSRTHIGAAIQHDPQLVVIPDAKILKP